MNIKNILPGLAILILLSACSSTEFISRENKPATKIDGLQDDWYGQLNIVKELKGGIGVKNDENFLYIIFTTKDQQKIMMMARTGFEVWFYPESETKPFAIQYPVKEIRPPEEFISRDVKIGEGPQPGQGRGQGMMFADFELKHPEFMIINEDELPLNLYRVDGQDFINVKPGHDDYRFAIEYKIPLHSKENDRISLGVKPGDKIRVHMKSGEMERPSGGPGMGRGGGMQGGPPAGGGMPGGGMGGRGGGPGGKMGNRERPDPVDFEFTITLTKE